MSKLKKVRSGKFTQISNIVFEDGRLSYKEIGLYCNMMKFPDDWEFSVRYLAECHQDKKAAVKTGIDRLLELGYISREGSQNRDEKGYFGTYDYVIYEDPFDNPEYIPWSLKENPKECEDAPLAENRTTDATDAENRLTENQHTDPADDENRLTDFRFTDERFADNPPTTNTVYTNTFYTNTFITNNEDDEDNAHVNLDDFRTKLMNAYMCSYYSCMNDPKAQREMMQAFNAIINAISEFRDPETIMAVNTCTVEEAERIWRDVYRNLFSTRLGGVIRDDIRDRHSYLKKYIASQLKSGYGPDPLDSYGVRR